jgi:heat shock protein 4
MLDACKIAEIKCLKLMNETSAVALEYGIFRRGTLGDETRHVMFVDMGYSKTSVCIAEISKKLVKIK